MEGKRPTHVSKDGEPDSAGKPGGSALVDPKAISRPIPQEERASQAIIDAAKNLPIPTKDPRWDPTNMVLDRKKADREAITQPASKPE